MKLAYGAVNTPFTAVIPKPHDNALGDPFALHPVASHATSGASNVLMIELFLISASETVQSEGVVSNKLRLCAAPDPGLQPHVGGTLGVPVHAAICKLIDDSIAG